MLKGSYVALVTPFTNGEIDYNALEKLIKFHIENKTDGILLCGTTGETPTLAGDEKERLIRFCVKLIDKRVPVMIGTGTNNLNHTIAATTRASQWGGDYALISTPYYVKPTQTGLYRFYKAVHDATDIPIVVYNVPGRTGCNIAAETVIKLANDCERIVGLKAASGDLIKTSIVVKGTSDDFSVMSGEDGLNLPLLSCGAKGAISVTANVAPSKVHDLIEAYANKDNDTALEIHQALIELNEALFVETNPIPVKEALVMMGYIKREFRLPMCELSENNRVFLNGVLKENGLI